MTDYTTCSEEELMSLWKSWYPGGSGPLGAMRTIVALIEAIARMRGFDPTTWSRQ